MATGYVLGVFAIIIAAIIHVVTGSNALGVMTAAALVEFCAGEGWDRLYSGLYPYLKMKSGRVCMVPYEQPGSQALFDAFEKRVTCGRI